MSTCNLVAFKPPMYSIYDIHVNITPKAYLPGLLRVRTLITY